MPKPATKCQAANRSETQKTGLHNNSNYSYCCHRLHKSSNSSSERLRTGLNHNRNYSYCCNRPHNSSNNRPHNSSNNRLHKSSNIRPYNSSERLKTRQPEATATGAVLPQDNSSPDTGSTASDVYRKSNSWNTFLRADSCHPKSLLKSIPKGQLIRLKRICTNSEDFFDQSMDLMNRFEARVAPEGHVSPETEQVSSPGSASSTHLEEHDEEDYDDDDDDDDAAAAIDTQIQASDHEEVPIETVLPPNRPANTTYDAIVASEGKIVEAENRRHSDLMTVLERMIALQEETVSQLAHLHRVFIEVPKQLQKINTSFEALVVQQTQANYWRMTNVPQFNTSQAGSVHAGQFSPHASDIHSPGPNVTGQVADIAVQVPDDILPLPSVQIQQLTPTKEATKRKHKQLLLTSFWSKTTKDTHETDQPSLVQCLPTCSHVSVGTSPVREQSLPKSPVGESLPKSHVGESLPKSPVGESLATSPVGGRANDLIGLQHIVDQLISLAVQ
ncbi:uncharacterized protein LOC142492375 [Ascaphus truei]|uniref:uncharacterized protein LOC142492375 n=1 Tax=Ascaphus truei TaxID=8439 RepID=UPI003F5AA5A9